MADQRWLTAWCLPLATLLLLVSAAAGQPCGNGALDLSLHGGPIADRFGIWTHGQPFGTAWLGIDVAPGRFPTPAGDLCLGLTPQFQALPLLLGADGIARVEGTLPLDLGLVGLTYHFQAAGFDAMAPAGISLSPARRVTVHRPRVFVLEIPRFFTPIFPTPPRIVAYDGLDTRLLWSRSGTAYRYLQSSPSAEVLCVSEADTFVQGLSAVDGSLLWSQALVAYGLTLSDDGRELLVLTATTIRRLDPRTGVVLGDVPHGLMTVSAPALNESNMKPVPGTDTLLVHSGREVVAVDLSGGTPARVLHVTPSSDVLGRWEIGEGVLAVLHGNPTTTAGGPSMDLDLVDIFSGSRLAGAPLRLATANIDPTARALAFGPTPSGLGFLVTPSPYELIEVRLDGQIGLRVAAPAASRHLVPTRGGLSWLRAWSTGSGVSQLEVLDALTLTSSVVGVLQEGEITHLTTRRSATFPVGFLASNRRVYAFLTNPAGPPAVFANVVLSAGLPFPLTSDLFVTDG